MKRAQRIAIITERLIFNPNTFFTLTSFSRELEAAKSTLSEDIAIISDTLKQSGAGFVLTKQGIQGGVSYCPKYSPEKALKEVQAVCKTLNTPNRVLPGGFLYWSDILSNPAIIKKLARIVAGEFLNSGADFVLTMETKGIPFAFMTAEALGIPLVMARRMSKVYEGSAVSINYFTGSGSLESMSLPKRAIKPGSTALIVDDFIKKGGTALGMCTLMKEFDVQVAGMAFMLSQNQQQRFISGDISLMTLSRPSEAVPYVTPSSWLKDRVSEGEE
ncbi:MAG: pur operon repressor [Eubacteriales bacterium]|nr:pur operon repressor [Eubacteriales bacterium]